LQSCGIDIFPEYLEWIFVQNGRIINSSSAAPVESLKIPPALVEVLRTNLGITNWFAMQAEVSASRIRFYYFGLFTSRSSSSIVRFVPDFNFRL
jgi:hypothetical protein